MSAVVERADIECCVQRTEMAATFDLVRACRTTRATLELRDAMLHGGQTHHGVTTNTLLRCKVTACCRVQSLPSVGATMRLLYRELAYNTANRVFVMRLRRRENAICTHCSL